jgi:hypothetical protein
VLAEEPARSVCLVLLRIVSGDLLAAATPS